MISRRFQLFEFGDQAFIPDIIRQVYHDCLGFVSRICGFYDRMYIPFSTWTKDCTDQCVLDLASGAAGPIDDMLTRAKKNRLQLPKVVLSDLYPNRQQFEALLKRHGENQIGYLSDSVSVTDSAVADYPLVSICAAFHHFPPAAAQKIVEQSLAQGQGIFIVEPFERKIPSILTTALLGPLLGIISPIFSFPWRLRNFFFCSVFPIVPLMVAFDGIVSVLRSYTTDELQEMIPKSELSKLRIRSGKLPTRTRQPAIFFYAIRR